jgi:CMP-N,N'-diacetyllegionaminic acid synthase
VGNIVGIIPARGGSVGVPLKNIKKLNNKPLIAYTIEAALNSNCLDRVIVSTDHDDIARISLEYGAEVPFIRPKDISEDVDTEHVLIHAIKYLEDIENYKIDAVVLLQPTSPFRSVETIQNCVKLYNDVDCADSIVGVNNIEGFRPEWMLSIDDKGKINPYATPFLHDNKPVIKLAARQSFPTLYKQNGTVYVTSRDLLMKEGLVIGSNAHAVITEEIEAVDIDTPVDFVICEALMKNTKFNH